jgi:hypothetical protein
MRESDCPGRERPVGLDNSAAQLATAPQLQNRFGLRFPLIHASAEQAPSPTPVLTLRSRSTARVSGAILTAGSPGRRGWYARAVS